MTPELWHTVISEAIATALVSIAGGALVYAWRMWQLPKLQAETIQELRELRIAIGQLSEQIRRNPRFYQENE